MPDVQFHPEARVDLREAVEWYDANNSAKADRLTEAIEKVIEELRDHPRRWPLIDSRYRIRPIAGFPFAVFYHESGNRIVIVAVSHSRRDQAYWRGRTDAEVTDETADPYSKEDPM